MANITRTPLFLLVLLALTLSACKPTPTATPTDKAVPPLPPTETPVSVTTLPPTEVPGETSTPAAANMSFTALDMKTTTTGWALTYTSILRTVDDGETWTDVSPAEWDTTQVPTNGFFLDDDHAWVLQTDPVDFEQGAIFQTSDGGVSWTRTDTPFGAGSMSFIDDQTGWVMAGLGAAAGSMAIVIFATEDGGATWKEVYRRDAGETEPAGEIPLVGSKQGISFRDKDHGWVAGSIPVDNAAYLYATSNGGVNFKQQEISLPSGAGAVNISLEAPIFFSQTAGVLPAFTFTADTSSTILYTTSDGGETWTPTTPVPVLGRYSAPSSSDFIVWDGTILYHSSDAGQTWSEITPNLNLDQMVAALDFVDSQNGWVTWMDYAGNSGLSHTSDGGATWVTLLP